MEWINFFAAGSCAMMLYDRVAHATLWTGLLGKGESHDVPVDGTGGIYDGKTLTVSVDADGIVTVSSNDTDTGIGLLITATQPTVTADCIVRASSVTAVGAVTYVIVSDASGEALVPVAAGNEMAIDPFSAESSGASCGIACFEGA